MGKSKKLKFSPKTEGEVRNNELSIEENKLPKMNKKKNKTPLSPDETEINQKFVSHDKTEPIKKKKNKKSSPGSNETETDISESLINENEETPIFSQMQNTKKRQNKKIKSNKENESVQSLLQTVKATESKKKKKTTEPPIKDIEAETDSVSQKKSKKRKREQMGESVSSSLEEATNLNIDVKKNKKKRLADEDEGTMEEPKSDSKAKKRKLKNSNFKNGGISHETRETDSEPTQKSKKKSNNKPEYSDKATPNNKDGRDSRTIFIGNVPVKYDKKALSKLLKEKGNLVRYWTRGYIPLSDKISKKTAAIANLLPEEHPPLVVYALFETAADAKNALTLNGAIFEDHRLRVTHSDTKLCPPELGVFVGNLPSNITDDDLYDFFSQCGKIVSTRVVRNDQGKGRGVAFVNFESTDSVELALKLHEEKFRDREIRVTRLKTKGQLEKMQKRKMLQASKDILSNKKHKAKKTGISSDKSDKFQKKKKKPNSIEFKKKILAEKLTSTPKRKEKKSE